MDGVNSAAEWHIQDGSDFHTSGKRRAAVKVASIDGGGTRGIIPSVILEEIEKILRLPISAVFDLIAGTSTGAIISTALNMPESPGSVVPLYSAKRIVEIFEEESINIFPYSYFGSFWQVFGPKYDPAGLHAVLRKYCKDFRLTDCIKEILIPAAEFNTRRPWWFTKRGLLSPNIDPDLCEKEMEKLLAWEVSAASAAAPTFFPPKPIQFGSKSYLFMDGGTFANNPARHAVSYASTLFGGTTPSIVASFGTGSCATWTAPYWCFNSGALFWGANFPTATLSLTAEDVVSDLHLSFPGRGNNQSFFVFQPSIEAKDFTLDGASPEHLQALKGYAQAFIDDHRDELLLLCNKLEHEHDAEERTELHEFYG